MRNKLILAAALMMAPVAALAQTTSGATSNSQDQAIAVVEGSNGGGGAGSSGYEDLHQSGHIYGTPSVGGSYSAFANPCGLSSSASGAGGPIGLAFSMGYEGDGCTNRANSAGFVALYGDRLASLARWCQTDKNADAYFASHGGPCIGRSKDSRYFVNGHEISATDTLRLASAVVGVPMVTLSNVLPSVYSATQAAH